MSERALTSESAFTVEDEAPVGEVESVPHAGRTQPTRSRPPRICGFGAESSFATLCAMSGALES